MTRRELIRRAPVLVVGACAWPQLAHGWTKPTEYFTHTVDIESFGRSYVVVMTWRLLRHADTTIAVSSVEEMRWFDGSWYKAQTPAEWLAVERQYRDRWPSMSFTSANEAEAAAAAVARAERYLFTAKPGDESAMKLKSYSLPHEWVEACRWEYNPPLTVMCW